MTKQKTLYDGATFTHNGRTFHVSIERDDHHGAPWIENDGHGPVTEWLSRDKKPGERVLHSDRWSKIFYDFAESIAITERFICAPQINPNLLHSIDRGQK